MYGFCNTVTYLCLRRCWMFTVHVTRHLNAIGLCFVCTCKLCSSRGCWHRGRLFRFYRVVWWRSGYFVSLTMGCVVVTEPFDLTSLVEDTRSPFQIGCKLFLAASVSQHGWAHYSLVVANGMLLRKKHRFADTVGLRKKARIAVTTHNGIIRGGAVMPFTSCAVSACRQTTQMFSISFWCVILRTRCERCPLRPRTCVQQSHATCAQDNNTSWLFARDVQFVDWVRSQWVSM